MTAELALTLLGLALVDSVNISTIWVVVAILLAARHPARTGWGFFFAAVVTFLAATMLLYFGAHYAADAIAGITLWLRRFLFVAIAVVTMIVGIRRLKTRERHGFTLPKWVNAWTALPLGAVATVGDLPNAFPMLLAIERLTDANVDPSIAVPALLAYTAVYALPTLIILVLGLIYGPRARTRMQKLYNRYATGPARRSWKIASLWFSGSLISVLVLIFVIR